MNVTFPTRILAGWQGRASHLLSLLALVAIAYTLAQAALLILFDGPAKPSTLEFVVPGSGVSVPAETETLNIASIATANLFGTAPDASASLATTQAPATRLSLHLWSIASGERPSAIISVGNQPMQLYMVGSQVQEGVRIAAIQADRVLLRHEGRLETLFFEDPEQRGLNVGAQRLKALPSAGVHGSKVRKRTDRGLPAATAQRLRDLAGRLAEKSDLADVDGPPVAEAETELPLAELQAGVNKVLASVAAGDDLRASHLSSYVNLDRYGLQPDDRILSFGGVDVRGLERSPKAILRAMGGLRQGGREHILVIQRGGQQITIPIPANSGNGKAN